MEPEIDLETDFEIENIGNGFYLFGTKKVYCKLINGKMVVRLGGGYVSAKEYVKSLQEKQNSNGKNGGEKDSSIE